MSDPVTNAEVEDVLSSIRRLVSEEKRPLPPAKAAARPAAPEPQSDRLVLTPALRVADEPSQVAEESHDETDDLGEPETLPDAAGADTAELPEQVDSTADDTSDIGLEDDYSGDPYNFEFDDDVSDNRETSTPLTLTSEARTKAEWAEDDAALPEEQVEEVKADWAEDDAELDWGEDAEIVSGEVDAPTKDEIVAADTKAATISAKIEALESALGGAEDEFEPDEVGNDPNSGTQAPAMVWKDDLSEDDLIVEQKEDAPFDFDHVTRAVAEPNDVPDVDDQAPAEPEAPIIAAAAPADNEVDPEDRPFSFDSEDQLIDEEALRDMVSDIVRAELQGALGERITRNVRKLVRREIHRALTTQDLE